jgi:hypothetical protein
VTDLQSVAAAGDQSDVHSPILPSTTDIHRAFGVDLTHRHSRKRVELVTRMAAQRTMRMSEESNFADEVVRPPVECNDRRMCNSGSKETRSPRVNLTAGPRTGVVTKELT